MARIWSLRPLRVPLVWFLLAVAHAPAPAAERPPALDAAPSGAQLLPVLRDGTRAERAAAFRDLLKLGRKAGPTLVEALSLEDPSVRSLSAQLAGEFGVRDAVPALLRLLTSPDVNVQQSSVDALGTLRDPRATAPLLELLARLRGAGGKCAVLRALGSIGEREARPYVDSLLQAADKTVQCCAAGALGLLGDPKGLAVALEYSRSDDPRLQRAALEALGQIGDPRGLDALNGLLSSPSPRNRAVAYIARRKVELKDRPRKEKVRALAQDLDEEEQVQGWAARELADLGDPEAVGSLKTHLRSPNGRLRRPILVQLYRLGVKVDAGP